MASAEGGEMYLTGGKKGKGRHRRLDIFDYAIRRATKCYRKMRRRWKCWRPFILTLPLCARRRSNSPQSGPIVSPLSLPLLNLLKFPSPPRGIFPKMEIVLDPDDEY